MTDYLSHSEIQQLVTETCEKLSIPQVTWRFSGRFTSKMGEARPAIGFVRFSKPLWVRATVEERRQVIIHEVCHVAAFARHGACQGHGHTWRALMVFCGVKPDRCHKVDNTDLRRRRRGSRAVVCGCPGKTHTLGPVRVRHMLAGLRVYSCRQCGQKVRLADQAAA